MKRKVVVLGLLMLGCVLLGSVMPALASDRAGTKVDLPEADNLLKTIEYFVRDYGLYGLALVLGGAGATQLGTRPALGLSSIGGGVIAGLWGPVAGGMTKSAAASTP